MRRSLLVIAALVLAGSALAPTSPARAQFKETPQSHLEFGLNTFRDGFYDPAIDAFRAYLKAAGNSKAALIVRYLLAEALRREDRLTEAIAAYQAFLRRHPRHERAGEVRFRVGVLAERIGDRKGAIRAYSSVNPGRYRTEAVYRVAALRLAMREWRGAVASLDEFIKSAPRDPRVEDALFERAIALDHIPRIREAEKAYSLVVRRFPRNPRAHAFRLRLAKIQLELKKFGSAEKTFDSLFQGRPGEKKRADLRLGQAASLFAQKKYPEAGAAFEAVLKMDLSEPQRRTAERGRASSWWRAGEYAKAAPAYQRLIREPARDGAYLRYFLQSVEKAGFCSEKGGEYLIFALDAIGKGAPLPSAHRFRMADCLLDAGLKKEAVNQYGELIRRVPDTSEAVWSGLRLADMLEKEPERNTQALLERYRQVLASFEGLRKTEKKPEPEMVRAVHQGVLRAAFIHNKHMDCARSVALVKVVPEEYVPQGLRSEVAFLRAECAWKAARFGEAGEHYRKVASVEGRPELAVRARYRLGELAEKRGDNKEALKRFQDVLPLLPEELKREARLKIGNLYRALGDLQNARAFLLPLAGDEALSASRRRSIWYFLAQKSFGARDWKGADEAFASWDALAPPDPGAGLRLWALVLFEQKDCGRAVKTAQRALQHERTKDEKLALHRQRASCFLKENNLEEFSGALRHVLALAPHDADAALRLGETFENMGDDEEAARAYTDFLGKFPNNDKAGMVALRLGRIELQRKRPEAASAAFRIAAKSNDGSISGPALFQIAVRFEKEGDWSKALDLFESMMRSGEGHKEWVRSATWRAAAIRESRREWKKAIGHYRSIAALKNGHASVQVGEEIKKARLRIRRLESYLASVKERDWKMKNQKPMLR
ncbi:MAG: tetratricopeptide repeat protein [Nitrospinae bacterium]|nr:tetratricopeptide repeat protein [Nitrospinota bacterium]